MTAFLSEKADDHARLVKLEGLAAHLAGQGSAVMSDERSDLNRAIQFVLSNLKVGLTVDAISDEIVRKRLLEIESWW